MKAIMVVAFLSLFVVGCATNRPAKKTKIKIIPAKKINWEKLNPARGEKSPQAGTLWGDRKSATATGFLVKFVDRFSSPPHIHNVSYRGVVISGLVHNDDPKAEKMWMPVGSYWTQPKGEIHITSAKGKNNVAYIEIENGPYLVQPAQKAFDSGERPVNIHSSNLVWIDRGRSQIAHLWGTFKNKQMNGALVRIPSGVSARIIGESSNMQIVVIKGRPKLVIKGELNTQELEPASYVSSGDSKVLQFSSSSRNDTIIYLRAKGKYSIK